MARLLIKTAGLENRILELHLGVNRVGRDPDCEICIDHSTVSSVHCELALSNDGVYIHDCNSTNGTFINGEPVMEAWLNVGQEIRLGDVALIVESTDAHISIPKFERARVKPPAILEGGILACNRHSQEPATYRCTHCKDVMCNHCVRIMRLKAGHPLFLCPLCSNKCEPIVGVVPKKKKGFIASLVDTVRLKFSSTPRTRR
jgi:hypothetical protein